MLYRYSYVYSPFTHLFINCNHNPTHDPEIHSYQSCRNLAWGTRFSNACQWGKIGKMAWQHICKRADQLPILGIKLIPEKQEILHFSIQTPTVPEGWWLVGGWATHLKNMFVILDHLPSVSGWKFQKYSTWDVWKPCKWWDKLPTSTGWPDFWTINSTIRLMTIHMELTEVDTQKSTACLF